MRIFWLHRAQRGAGLRRVAALSGEMESGGDADVVRGVDAFAGMPGDASSFAAESDTDRFGLQLGELKETPAAADFRGDVADQDSTRRFGQRWATGVEAAAIRVPSVIIPIEFNVLLNPTHSVYGDRVVGAGAVSVEQAAIMKTTA